MMSPFKLLASSMKTRTKPQSFCGLFKDETLENQLKRRNKEAVYQQAIHQRWLKTRKIIRQGLLTGFSERAGLVIIALVALGATGLVLLVARCIGAFI